MYPSLYSDALPFCHEAKGRESVLSAANPGDASGYGIAQREMADLRKDRLKNLDV